MAKALSAQKLLVQRETAPGTAKTDAMKQMTAMGLRPGWNVETNTFRPPGWKLPTVVQQTDEWGVWDASGIQDYNHLGVVLASRIAMPVTSQPDASNSPTVYQHVFTLNPSGPDTKATYTVQFGDTDRAIQGLYGVFQSLGINVQRGSLGFTTSFISRTPTLISSVATSGVTTMAAAPTAARQFDIFADDAWADLGDTKLLAAYEGALDLGDKFARDTPINSSITSYESLVEAEDAAYTGTLRLGFDTTAAGLITTFENAARKFFRIKSTGPIISDDERYLFQIDFCAQVVPGTIEAFNNGTMTLPVNLTLVPDPVSGDVLEVTLVNTISAY